MREGGRHPIVFGFLDLELEFLFTLLLLGILVAERGDLHFVVLPQLRDLFAVLGHLVAFSPDGLNKRALRQFLERLLRTYRFEVDILKLQEALSSLHTHPSVVRSRALS